MKKFLHPLIALLPLISSLSAQNISIPDIPLIPIFPISAFPIADNPSPAETTPIGNNPETSNNPSTIDNPLTPPALATSYPIGSFEKPVFAAEYCTFLSDINAPQTETSLDAVEQKYLGTENPVICYGNPGNVQFAISLEDQMHQIVTTVPSSNAQYLFNLWRANPTSIELASYLNDKYHLQWKTGSPATRPGYTAEANSLKSAYPNSTTLSFADTISANPQIGMVFTFLNDRQTTLITISRSQFQNMDGWVSTLKKQTDYYHRPSNIAHDNILM